MTGPAAPQRPGPAGSDLAIAAGGAWTGLGPRVDAGVDAVGVAGGRIAAVGRLADVRDRLRPGSPVVEIPGGLILPGFQDAHCHPSHGGYHLIRCDLHDVHGADAVVEAVRTYADAHRDVPWILGGGWHMADYPGGTPSRHLLDAVVPDRPVLLVNRDEHGAWVNSLALRHLGFGRETPDPPFGRLEREPDGSPQGTLHEGAMAVARRRLPPQTSDERDRAMAAGIAHLHAQGITAIQDAWVEPDDLVTYLRLQASGRLTARVRAALWWEREAGLEQIAGLRERRRAGTIGRLDAGSVKIMADGVMENFTASVLDPYLAPDGSATAERGIAFVERDRLAEAVRLLDADGFQVHVHAIGDRAVRDALDAFAGAIRANGRRDNRHHIAHVQLVHPDDVGRFAELDVTATMQPFWACHDAQMDELTLPILGPVRAAWQYPFGSLVRSGARLAGGSDWSVSTSHVLSEIQVAMTRTFPDPGVSPEPLDVSEALDLDTALRAFTAGSAHVNHLDDMSGTLEVGRLADIAVVDRDIGAVDPTTLLDARVALTLVEGEPVHVGDGVRW
jgi:predicted amidohydrolase YtcJ